MSRQLVRKMQHVLYEVSRSTEVTPKLKRRAKLVLLEMILSNDC